MKIKPTFPTTFCFAFTPDTHTQAVQSNQFLHLSGGYVHSFFFVDMILLCFFFQVCFMLFLVFPSISVSLWRVFRPGTKFCYALTSIDSQSECITELRPGTNHIPSFYCHGVISGITQPYTGLKLCLSIKHFWHANRISTCKIISPELWNTHNVNTW